MMLLNKHKLLIIVSTIMVVLLIVLNIIILDSLDSKEKEYEVMEFDLDDYQEYIEYYREYRGEFSSDYYVGNVTTAGIAVETATYFWNKQFGYNSRGEYINPNPGADVCVYYDADTKCWLITGTAPKRTIKWSSVAYMYELPNAIIQTDGTILALWTG